ncbi:MAG: hypothetical protein ACKVP3_02235 [Hyphomicrobiaceae bacterium]
MQKIVIGLSALLLVVTGGARSVAQDLAAERGSASYPDCNYVCVYAASVDEPWSADHSQSHFVEPQPERERRASHRRAISDMESEVLSAMARQRAGR